MSGLKPCPFCGKIPVLNVLKGSNFNEYYVECKSRYCIEQKHCYRTRKAAIDAWNRRSIGEDGEA